MNLAFFQYKRVSSAKKESKATKKAIQHKINPKKSIEKTKKLLLETKL